MGNSPEDKYFCIEGNYPVGNSPEVNCPLSKLSEFTLRVTLRRVSLLVMKTEGKSPAGMSSG